MRSEVHGESSAEYVNVIGLSDNEYAQVVAEGFPDRLAVQSCAANRVQLPIADTALLVGDKLGGAGFLCKCFLGRVSRWRAVRPVTGQKCDL